MPAREHRAGAVDLDRGDDPGEREVTTAPRHLFHREAGTTRPDGEVHRAEDLVLADGRGPRPDEELGRGHGAGAARAGDLELGVERERDRGELRRGVGMGDGTTDGPAVADLEVADQRDGLGQERHRFARRGVVLDRALRRHRLDRECAVRTRDAAEVVDPVEVDDVLEAREPQRQHRHEALTARQHLGLVAVLREQRDDVGDRFRCVVLERCGLHGQLPRKKGGVNLPQHSRGRTLAAGGSRVGAVSEEELPPAIPAATVVLLRDAADGVETLMLRRDSKLAFAGGAWVFPGGRIDPEDYPGGAVSDDDDAVLAAARNAAAREAMEEAGLVVDPATLVWFAHWTPGAIAPRRFATWFFVGVAPEGRVVVDDGEIREHQWIRPADALARREIGEIELIPPTWVTLHALAGGVEHRRRVRSGTRPRPADLLHAHRPGRRRDRVDLAGRRRVRRPRHREARSPQPIAHARHRMAARDHGGLRSGSALDPCRTDPRWCPGSARCAA